MLSCIWVLNALEFFHLKPHFYVYKIFQQVIWGGMEITVSVKMLKN